MNQLINDQQKRKCPFCQNEFVGYKILEHEKVCQNKQDGQQYQQNVNQIPIQKNYERNSMNIQQIQNPSYLDSIQQTQQLLKKCEYCNEDYPLEVYNLHIKDCDARVEMQTLLQNQFPSQLLTYNQQNFEEEENEKQKIGILTLFFELIEKKGDILEKGEELVKISNFSIEPFTRTFEKKMCRSCKKNFILDEEILIMKCCFQLYHNICFAEIIKKTINCECGKQIIID